MSEKSLEACALEALIAGDDDLAVQLVNQMLPGEARILASAAWALACFGGQVATEGRVVQW